ncbi:MAG TPA: response regulator [Nitrospira sp.]|nr:response regulator [Nitrospira sp.]
MAIRILVADDEPDILSSLAERLRWMGHEVITAADGQAAVAAVEQHEVDLVFLDVAMPRVSGIEALKRIRKRWPNVPVVMLTAYGTIPRAVESMKEGAADFITKPFDAEQIQSVVTMALDRREQLGDMTRLLGEISHDVKNLLMPMVTGTDLLSEEIDDLFKHLQGQSDRAEASHQACEEVVQLLRHTSQRIQARMKEIADYVAVTGTPHQMEACQIAKVAEAMAKTLRVLLQQKRIQLRLEGLDSLPAVPGDPKRLYSLLYNLVHNAIPEVPPHGWIMIRARHEPGAASVVITVEDNGTGMPEDVRRRLFTSRVASRKAGGTGLGMKIVKDVIDAHGGSIQVESQEGAGTKFLITLPLHASAGSDQAKPRSNARRTGQPLSETA